MTRGGFPRRAAIVLAWLAFVGGGACTADDTTGRASSSSTTATATPTKTEAPTPAQNVDLDAEMAEKARLTAEDLPGTWDKPPPGSAVPLPAGSSGSTSSSTSFLTCADPPPDFDRLIDMERNPHAKSSRLKETGTSRRLTEELYFLADVGAASRLMAMFRDPRFTVCMNEAMGAMEKQFGSAGTARGGTMVEPAVDGSGTEPGRATGPREVIRPVDVLSAGDDILGFDLDPSIGGTSSTERLVFVRVDRVVILLTIDDARAPTDDELHALAVAAEAKLRATMDEF
jgi:hypothetical protein